MYIGTALDLIFSHLHDLRLPIASKRRLGLDPIAVTNELHALRLEGPADLVKLYSLCDGTENSERDLLDDILFFPGFYWMNFDDVIDTYRSLVKDKRWNAAWLPIFANGGGDFYAIVCDQTSRDFGSVVGFIVDDIDQMVEFENLNAFFEVIERSYSDGVFYIHDGNLNADYAAMRKIAKSVQGDFIEHAF